MSPHLIKIKLLFILLWIPFVSFSQHNTVEPVKDTVKSSGDTSKAGEKVAKNTESIHVDTIYFFESQPMHVNVMKITYDSVIYREPGKTNLKAVDKDKVNKIKYNWGKVEILNEKKPRILRVYNWRKVKILKSEEKTEGLFMVERIEAKVKGSNRGYDTPKSLENRARIILRKKAGNLNAKYVLITNKNITIAFGELPSASLTGIAYTDEELPQRSENQE